MKKEVVTVLLITLAMAWVTSPVFGQATKALCPDGNADQDRRFSGADRDLLGRGQVGQSGL